MRKILFAFILLALATPLFASDPMVGTWKLNAAKTKYTVGAPAKDVTVVIEEQGANLQVTATGTNSDGSPLSIKYTIPVKGGAGSVQQGDYNGITTKVISANVRENKFTKDGKWVRTRRSVVAADGKSMSVDVKGTNALGKETAGVDFFDKQ